MSIVPRKQFINNEIPIIFNKDSFEVTTVNSDNLTGTSLDISGQSNLNNLDVIWNLNSINIVNTGSITSNGISNVGNVTTNSLTSSSIANSGTLTSNTITSSGLITAANGLTVSSGTISLPGNSVGLSVVNSLSSRLLKLDNLTGSTAINSTISSNTLTINYATNTGQSIFVNPTANFSLVLTGVPTTILNATYKLEIYISAKFYCTGITVNCTSLTMVAVGGFSNIAGQVNVNATGLIQQFIIFFTGTTTPTRVSTMLLSTW